MAAMVCLVNAMSEVVPPPLAMPQEKIAPARHNAVGVSHDRAPLDDHPPEGDPVTHLMLAAFCFALGYWAGRTDRVDLGPLRRRRLDFEPLPRPIPPAPADRIRGSDR